MSDNCSNKDGGGIIKNKQNKHNINKDIDKLTQLFEKKTILKEPRKPNKNEDINKLIQLFAKKNILKEPRKSSRIKIKPDILDPSSYIKQKSQKKLVDKSKQKNLVNNTTSISVDVGIKTPQITTVLNKYSRTEDYIDICKYIDKLEKIEKELSNDSIIKEYIKNIDLSKPRTTKRNYRDIIYKLLNYLKKVGYMEEFLTSKKLKSYRKIIYYSLKLELPLIKDECDKDIHMTEGGGKAPRNINKNKKTRVLKNLHPKHPKHIQIN